MKHIKRFNESSESELFTNLEMDNMFRRAEATKSGEHGLNLLSSLKKIGDGKIVNKTNSYMYKEDLGDNLLLIVFGSVDNPFMDYGLSYEIKVIEDRATKSQVGGGYGTSGIIFNSYPTLLHYDTYHNVFKYDGTISLVTDQIKDKIKQI